MLSCILVFERVISSVCRCSSRTCSSSVWNTPSSIAMSGEHYWSPREPSRCLARDAPLGLTHLSAREQRGAEAKRPAAVRRFKGAGSEDWGRGESEPEDRSAAVGQMGPVEGREPAEEDRSGAGAPGAVAPATLGARARGSEAGLRRISASRRCGPAVGEERPLPWEGLPASERLLARQRVSGRSCLPPSSDVRSLRVPSHQVPGRVGSPHR